MELSGLTARLGPNRHILEVEQNRMVLARGLPL